jgi:hypothetical protein
MVTLDVLHADHALLPVHFEVVRNLFEKRADGFHALTVKMGMRCPALPCGLHGPLMGDEPVPASEVTWATRGARSNLSRLCARPSRPSWLLTAIGVRCGDTVRVFTAYGGPLAPREITDPSLLAEAAEESLQFWARHALSRE